MEAPSTLQNSIRRRASGTGRPIAARRWSETHLSTSSAEAMASPSHIHPVTSSSTANRALLSALAGLDQFQSQSGRSTTKK